MSSVDNRIVRMTFDNQKFENGVRTTIQSLANLKKGLQLEGASKSLSKLEKAADGMTFAGLAKNVDTISSRFSNLGIVGVTALQNITNSVMHTGEQMIKSLTIDPITTGFDEYETKINAIQTIMSNTASKGTTMSDITAVLNELNTYADKTIYNFAEMTKNIGTFTAAGINLEDAASSIQGIANLAAASGSTSQQASTAMYQLSQALAAGTVKLMDWNSVVNAGMGGEKFQEALKSTAREYGVNVDAMISKNGSFRESLQEGWISADILNDTLKKFTVEGATEYAEAMMRSGKYTKEQAEALIEEAHAMEDAATKVKTWTQLWDTMKESAQSGWAQSWELVVGNFLEARDFFTQVSDIIGGVIEKSAESRNSMLDEALTSNWTKLTRAINAAGVETDVFEQKVKDLATASGYDIGSIIKEYDSLESAIRKGALPLDLLNQALDSFSGTIESVKVDKTTADFEKLTSTLRRGDATASVRELQQALKDFGYDLSKYGVDGVFGAETEAAVKAFQQANGLIANGIADSDTIAALKKVGTTISGVTVDVEGLNTTCKDLVGTVTQKSGRELILDSIINALKSVIQIGDTAKSAFDAIFDPSDDAQQLLDNITKIHDFSADMLQSVTDHSDELGRALKGVFAILDIVGSTGKTIATGGLKILCSVLGIAGDNALELAANAGDAIVAFHEWFEANNILAKSFDYIADGIPVLISLAKEWFAELRQTPEVQAILSELGEEVDNIVEYFKGGKQVILDFISRVKSLDEINLDSLDDIFRDFCDNVVSYFTDIDKVVEGGKKIFDTLKTKVVDVIDKVLERLGTAKEKIVDFVDSVKEKFSGFGMAEVMLIGFSSAILGVGIAIYKALKVIKGGIFGINEVLDSISGAFNAIKFNLQVKAFATMIVTLVGALALMTTLNQEKLLNSAKVLGWFAAGIVAAMTALSVLQHFKLLDSFQSNATSIIAIAASLAIMVAALKGMEYINFEDGFGKRIATLIGLMTALGIAAGVMGNFAPKLSTGALTMVAYAASMVILAEAMNKLSEIPADKIGTTLQSMFVLMGMMTVLSIAAKNVKFGAAVTMVASILTLNALIDAFERIKTVDARSILDNVEAFVLIFGAFAGLMVASRVAGSGATGAGIGILAMSSSILVIIEAFERISMLDTGSLLKGLGIMVTMFTIFGLITKTTASAGDNAAKAGVTILAMSAGMLILAGAITMLSDLDVSGMWNAVGVVTVMGAVMAGIVYVTKYAQSASKTIIVVTACIFALSIVVGLMSAIAKTNPEGLWSAVGAIGVIGTVLALVVASTKLAQKASGTLILITIAVAAIAGVLALISDIPAEQNVGNALALSTVLLAISGAMAILQNVPAAGAAKAALALVAGLSTLVGVAATIGYIVEFLSGSDGTTVFETFADIMGSLGTAIGDFVGNIIGGLFGGLTSGLPQIAEDLRDFANTIGEVDPSVGNGAKALAEAFIAITGAAFLEGLLTFGANNSIEKFAEQAPIFGKALTSFADSISDLDAGDIDAINTATEAAKALVDLSNEVPKTNGLIQFITGQGDLGTFGVDLSLFGAAMKLYAWEVRGLDTAAIETSIIAAEALVDLAKTVPNTRGLIQFFTGQGDLSTFGFDLACFGVAMKSYAKSVSGLDTTAIETSITAAESLVKLAKTVPGISTLWDFLAGGKGDLGTFGNDLYTFGLAMKQYSNSIKNIDVTAIETSVTAASALVDLANEVPGISTLWDWFAGGKGDLSTFGNDLYSFGYAIANYSRTVSGIDTGKLDAVTASMSSLITLAGSSSVTNFEGFANFGEALTQLGKTGVDGFISAFTNSTSRVQAAAATMMSSFNTGITSKQGTIDASISNIVSSALTKIRNQYTTFNSVGQATMTQFIAGVKAHDGTAQSTISNIVNAMLTRIRNQYTTFNSVGQATMTQFIAGVKAHDGTAQSTISNIVNAMLTRIRNQYTTFNSVGQATMTQFIAGVKSQETAATDAISNIASSCASAARNYYSSFYDAGVHCVNGFAAGISDRTRYAEAKARAMASAAKSAAEAELDVNSPSREFYKIGRFGVLGFANAFIDGLSMARTVGGNLAGTALDSFKASLSRIGEVLDGGIDAQPTIAPVLDLSNIRAGVGQLNAMVSRNQAVTVSSNIASRKSGSSSSSGSESSIPVVGNTYNYTQNNYSPKPISTIEVYRQTKNLISIKEGGLTKA